MGVPAVWDGSLRGEVPACAVVGTPSIRVPRMVRWWSRRSCLRDATGGRLPAALLSRLFCGGTRDSVERAGATDSGVAVSAGVGLPTQRQSSTAASGGLPFFHGLAHDRLYDQAGSPCWH